MSKFWVGWCQSATLCFVKPVKKSSYVWGCRIAYLWEFRQRSAEFRRHVIRTYGETCSPRLPPGDYLYLCYGKSVLPHRRIKQGAQVRCILQGKSSAIKSTDFEKCFWSHFQPEGKIYLYVNKFKNSSFELQSHYHLYAI